MHKLDRKTNDIPLADLLTGPLPGLISQQLLVSRRPLLPLLVLLVGSPYSSLTGSSSLSLFLVASVPTFTGTFHWSCHAHGTTSVARLLNPNACDDTSATRLLNPDACPPSTPCPSNGPLLVSSLSWSTYCLPPPYCSLLLVSIFGGNLLNVLPLLVPPPDRPFIVVPFAPHYWSSDVCGTSSVTRFLMLMPRRLKNTSDKRTYGQMNSH